MTFTNFEEIAEGKRQTIKFIHVATKTNVSFPAFLTEYSDTYAVQWGDEQIFGRNDPIKPYQSTTRNIAIAFDVLSHSMASAKNNLAKYTTLTKMLYPVYTPALNNAETSLGRTIKAPPLIRIKFVNMIQSADGDGSLLGCINGFAYAPSQEPGFFVDTDGSLFPKHFNISFSFTPQHESPLGWDSSTRRFLTEEFPYASTAVEVERKTEGTQANTRNASRDKAFNP